MRGIEGQELNWVGSGRGPGTVLLVHGFPFSGDIWADQLADVPAGWRYLAPDLPGFGRSPAWGRGPLTMAEMADALIGFLDARGAEQAVVCGLSMGGYVALALWRAHASRVRALVLADTRAGADAPAARAARYGNAARARREGVAVIAEGMLPGLLCEGTRRERPEVVARLRTIMEGASAEGVAGALEGMAERPDSSDVLSTIDVPTLVLVGEGDALTPPDEARRLAGAIPGARLEVLPAAGHVSSMEAPAAFNAELRAFLSGIPPL